MIEVVVSTCLIIFISLLLFYFLLVKPHNYWREKGIFQEKTTYLFGDALNFVLARESFSELVLRLGSKLQHARYYGTYLFNYPILIVKDPDLIKDITVRDFEHFTDHSSWLPENVDPLWGNNLFSLKGDKWKEMRLFFRVMFTSSKMKFMFNLMKDCAENFVTFFEEKEDEIIEIDLKPALRHFTCDVIATTVFGVRANTLRRPNNTFYQMGVEATNSSGIRSFIYLFHFALPESIIKFFDIKVYSSRVRNFFIQLLESTMEAREKNGIVRPDMIHIIMEAKKGVQQPAEEHVIDTGYATALDSYAGTQVKSKTDITNTDILAQSLIFFFGGFDTVSTLMRFMAYELVVNPKIQDKLRDEINDTFDACDGSVTYEDLLKMKYMDNVMSETLRKWPSGLAVERICTKAYPLKAKLPHEKDVILPEGTLVCIPTFGLHRNPEYYPDPDLFDPDRFDDKNKSTIKPYTYFPFGVGPRNCVGSRYAVVEAKVLFFYLLRVFELVPVESSKIPIKINRSNFHLDGNGWKFGLKKLHTSFRKSSM
ncbi:unnamed protein product [Diabrotica balteata]|uniref:Cytochrome P450 n=1 Tax=Diabrotica balteata TaxID=107213 RepID=A0A9N9SP62_DIABA|nr:unnamed protein product [Diabrotica balteata]